MFTKMKNYITELTVEEIKSADGSKSLRSLVYDRGKKETKGGDTRDKISRGKEPNERSRIDSFVTTTPSRQS